MEYNKISIPVKIGKETWYIGSDKHNFIFGKKKYVDKILKKKKVTTLDFDHNTCSYYPSIEYLIEQLHIKLIKTRKAETFEQLEKNIDLTRKQMVRLFKTIKREELKS